MTVDQNRLNTIVTLAEDLYPEGEYADMAYDILSSAPERADSEIAQELAMRCYGQ